MKAKPKSRSSNECWHCKGTKQKTLNYVALGGWQAGFCDDCFTLWYKERDSALEQQFQRFINEP